jgi:solute carrier family 25 (mitochondrial oxoglutarate transporter), member 11
MAGAAASHPLDVIKVRMQIEAQKASAFETAAKVFRERSMFAGLSASLARQAVYSSCRFGVYDYLKRARGTLSFAESIACGLVAGGFGAVVANPLDLTLVRMQADAKLALDQRRNYKNVFDGVIRIFREEGVMTLYRGSSPTCARAMVITASQFAVYDKVKAHILHSQLLPEGTLAHFSSALTAGFVASCTSNPFDVIKTRVYNAKPGTYKNPIDCLRKTVAEGGPMALYKGFVPTFVRQAPYVIVMFITNEQLKKLWTLMEK